MSNIHQEENHEFDLAIKNGFILSLDQDWTEYSSGLILINNDRIEYVGSEDGYQNYIAKKTIDARGGIVMPTFFNGHTHSAMSIFRGMGSDQPLDSWLKDYIWPAEAKYLDPENVYLGSMVSAIEMIRCGTGAFVDMYFFQEETLRACEKLGIRVVLGEGILDFPTPNKKTPEEGFRYTEYLWNKYRNHPLASISLPAHSPYTCSPEVLREVGVLARKLDIPATIHLAETAWEDGEMKSKYGKSSTQLLTDLGFFDGKSVAYHCNHLSSADIELLRENNVGIITNPYSNMKLGSGICPVPELLEKGLTIGIGTDGPASNNNQCMLLDMQFLARLHKMNKLDPTVLNARQVIKMATNNGAKNYGLGNELGTLEKGKLADLMIIDTEQAHWIPLNDPYSQIVYSMQPGDVNCTIINGELIMEDHKIITVDEEYFISEISQLGKKIASQY